MQLNKLYLDDKGVGNVKFKLNGQDITEGMLEYKILRTTDEEYLTIDFKMKVIPEYVNIELQKQKEPK